MKNFNCKVVTKMAVNSFAEKRVEQWAFIHFLSLYHVILLLGGSKKKEEISLNIITRGEKKSRKAIKIEKVIA